MPRHGGNGSRLVVHVRAGLAAATHHRLDDGRGVAAIAGALDAGHDDGGAVVGLHAAVEQVERLDDHAAVQHVVHAHALFVVGLGIVRRVLRVDHLHHRDLLGAGSVVVHVPHERLTEHLSGAHQPVAPREERIAGERRHRTAVSRSADPHLRVPVHRAIDDDGVAHPRLDHAHGDPDEGLGARAAAVDIHVEVEADPQVARDRGGGRRIVVAVGEHPIDVTGFETRVGHRRADRPRRQTSRRRLSAAHIARFTDAHDRVFAPQAAGRVTDQICHRITSSRRAAHHTIAPGAPRPGGRRACTGGRGQARVGARPRRMHGRGQPTDHRGGAPRGSTV